MKKLSLFLLAGYLFCSIESYLITLKEEGIIKSAQYIIFKSGLSQENLIKKKREGNCLVENQLNITFGKVCFNRSHLFFDERKIKISSELNTNYYPRVKFQKNKLFVMYLDKAKNLIHINIYDKSKGKVDKVKTISVRHGHKFKSRYTINQFNFNVIENEIIVAITSGHDAFYGSFYIDSQDSILKFKKFYGETSWVESEPVVIRNENNVFILFSTGTRLGEGGGNKVTLISKFDKKLKKIDSLRVFRGLNLELTGVSQPLELVEVDSRGEFIFNDTFKGRTYKVKYENLSNIPTLYEVIYSKLFKNTKEKVSF